MCMRVHPLSLLSMKQSQSQKHLAQKQVRNIIAVTRLDDYVILVSCGRKYIFEPPVQRKVQKRVNQRKNCDFCYVIVAIIGLNGIIRAMGVVWQPGPGF